MGNSFKLTGIPKTTTESILRAGIASQLPKTNGKGLIISLHPDPLNLNKQIATVTFAGEEPRNLAKCKKNTPVSGWKISVAVGSVKADVDFYDMTPLYVPANPRCDIIAVTGLAGHAFGSWKARGGDLMWLRDFLPTSLAAWRPRIMTWGYDSELHRSTSKENLAQFGRRLLDAVHNARDDKYRPIIFIGHSLGGLVIKQALTNPRPRPTSMDEAIYNSCAGIFFFGVPHKGLNHQNLLTMVEDQPNEPLVQDLLLKTDAIQLAYQNFLRYFRCDDCYITSFYETRQSSTVVKNDRTGLFERGGPLVMMVTKESATWASPNQQIQVMIPVDADHSEIVKFVSPSDKHYVVAMEQIRECIKESPRIVAERWKKLGRH